MSNIHDWKLKPLLHNFNFIIKIIVIYITKLKKKSRSLQIQSIYTILSDENAMIIFK